jgi:hypothetical protein
VLIIANGLVRSQKADFRDLKIGGHVEVSMLPLSFQPAPTIKKTAQVFL